MKEQFCKMNTKSVEDIMQLVQYFENKYCVDKWIINNVLVWPVIRKNIIEYLIGGVQLCENNNNSKKEKFVKRLKRFYNCFIRVVYTSLKINFRTKSDKKIVFFSSSSSRRILVEKKWYNVNIEPFFEFFQKKGFASEEYELMFCDTIKFPRYVDAKIVNFQYFWCIIKTRIKCLFSKSDFNIQNQDYGNFAEEWSNFGFPKTVVSSDRISREIIFISYFSDFFCRDFIKSPTRLAFMVCWYNRSSMAFSLACHRLGIPCYDIQHGCAGASMHPFYYGWNKIPKDGYELMPTGFWCWDEDDAKAIQAWDANGYRFDTIVGGRPIRDMITESPAMFLSDKSMEVIETIQHDKRPKILVSLTTVFSIPQWCIDYIRRTDKYLWIVREHPCFDEVQTKITQQLNNFSHIIIDRRNDGIPLELDLMHVDCHVTHNSSVIIDAMAAGVRSIMLDKDNVNRYDYIARRGYCELATNEANLNSILEKKLQEKLFSICKDKNTEQGLSKLLSVVEK